MVYFQTSNVLCNTVMSCSSTHALIFIRTRSLDEPYFVSDQDAISTVRGGRLVGCSRQSAPSPLRRRERLVACDGGAAKVDGTSISGKRVIQGALVSLSSTYYFPVFLILFSKFCPSFALPLALRHISPIPLPHPFPPYILKQTESYQMFA